MQNQQRNNNNACKAKAPRKPRKAKAPNASVSRTMVSTRAPTLNQVQNNSRAVVASRALSSPYMHCRMNVYSSKGNVPIPDGRNSKFIVVDHFIADAISAITTSGFTIQTYPFLPYTAAVIGNGGAAAKDIVINGNILTNPGDFNGGLFPIGVPTEWNSTLSAPGDNIADPYQATAGRIISVTRRLIYLSPSQTATGLITVTPRVIGCASNSATTSATSPAGAGEVSLNAVTLSQTLSGTAPKGTPILTIDSGADLNTTQFTRDSVTTRVENGVVIRGKAVNDDHELRPFVNTAYGISQNKKISATTAAGGTILTNLFCTNSPGATQGGISFYDPTWQSQVISVSGVVVGASFRLETVICMEYALGQSSPFAPLSRSAVPAQPEIVKHVDSIINALPVAMPGSDPR